MIMQVHYDTMYFNDVVERVFVRRYHLGVPCKSKGQYLTVLRCKKFWTGLIKYTYLLQSISYHCVYMELSEYNLRVRVFTMFCDILLPDSN